MGKQKKIAQSLKRGVAIVAILGLLSTVFISFAIPRADAELDVEAPEPVSESYCDENQDAVQCDSENATSFTNFQGSFDAPDESGYAEGITQTSSAREFIVNITNFVLSFLGLAAVIVIIYGGFMYVTAAGEQERADKGKKSVLYAIIGIIIVLISFALVNTIITGAGGGGEGGSGGSGGLYSSSSSNGAGVNSQRLRDFRAEKVDEGIKQIIEDVIDGYETYANVNSIITAMVNVGKFDRAGLREMKEGFHLIMKEVDPFSNTADSVQKGLLLLDRYITFDVDQKIRSFASFGGLLEANTLKASPLLANSNFPSLPPLVENQPPLTEGQTSQAEPVINPLDLLDPNRMGEAVTAYIQITAQIAHEEFKMSMAEQRQKLLDLQASFQDLESISSLIDDINAQLTTYIEGVYNERTATVYFAQSIDLPDLGSLPMPAIPLPPVPIPGLPFPLPLPPLPPPPPPPPAASAAATTAMELLLPAVPGSTTFTYKTEPIGGSRQVGLIIEMLNELYNLQKNLQYTSAVITSNTTQGNTPLTVTFNGLDSYDPTDISVSPEQYTWDLLGDGFGAISEHTDISGPGPSIAAISADNRTGSTATYTYTEPGTYRVGLRVTSNDPDNIAAGISYQSIKVNPPSSIIDLNVTGGLSNVTTHIEENQRVVSFTGEDAKAGLTFDAGATTDGNGNLDTIVNFDFDFGDGETSDGVNPEVTHYYTEEGTYRMELEVTDQNGVKDRRPLTVIVASPAAHLEASHERADIGDTITFDASASLTDFGAINSYMWEIERVGDPAFSYGPTSGGEEFEYEFSQPGDYIVTVEVTDSSGQSNATSLTVKISSSKPVAAFDYKQGSTARPNILTFDGTSSYDPDEGDDLTPVWTIEEQGYESLAQFIEGTDSGSWKPVIEFFEPGDYTISLAVSDQYEGDLKQTNVIKKEVSVDSVLAIGVRNTGQTAIFLNEDGTAEVELELSTSTGQAFEIDWGDGSEVETFSNGSSSSVSGDNRFHVWGMAGHKYDQAGTFHVEITVLDAENRTNALTRNVYIGNGTEPIPVLNAYIDNIEAQDPNNVEANRINTIRFDAGDSVDLDGNPINQTGAYSWVLGDGTRATGKQLTKSYDELGEFEVTLTVRSSVDSSIAASTTILISITDSPPQLFGMTIQPQSTEAITPLVVKATANAQDSDGEITRYKFWYYDVNNSSETLGEQISLTSETYLTINTKGTTGQVNTYAFAVEVTDNENNTVSSFDEIPAEQMPTLEVENGPNNAPEADISVDRTNVLVGETVTFTSNSFDEDGEIVEYIWDLEGDGFFNNASSSESTILHEYTETHPEGVPVRLKVVDNTGATDVSNPIRIYVDSLTQDPVAAFRYEVNVLNVTLVNNSSADTANNAEIASYAWDFDTSKDSDGDGDGGNDVDSTEENPKHVYENFGAHTVQLTVTDNEGNTDSVSNIVQLIEITAPKAGFKYKVVNDLAVQFENVSVPGDETAAPIETYKWDFDADGITDSDQREPRFEFEDYGSYQTTLVVTDALDRSDDYTKTVTVEEPEPEELVAFLTTVPAGDPRRGGDIYLQGESGDVTFSYRSKDGVGEVKFCIDKNVFFDTDGNGKKDDDCDNPSGQAGSWKTSFSKDWGMIVVKMTATDELDRDYTVTKQIFFENPDVKPGGASVLPVSSVEGLYILLTALGFTLLGAKLYTRKQEETSL